MHNLTFEIDYAQAAEDCDIDCWLAIGDSGCHLRASPYIPPFMDLLALVKAVAKRELPHEFFWNELGVCATFAASSVAGDDSLVHLKITHELYEEAWLDLHLEREQVIRTFLQPLLDLDQNFLVAESIWGLSRVAVRDVQQEIELLLRNK